MWLDKKIIKVLDLNKLWTLLEFIFCLFLGASISYGNNSPGGRLLWKMTCAQATIIKAQSKSCVAPTKVSSYAVLWFFFSCRDYNLGKIQ